MRISVQITVQSLSTDTSLHTHDVVSTLMLLGFLRKSVDNRFILAVDWSVVDAHDRRAKEAVAAGTRVNLNPDALRWSPPSSLVHQELFRTTSTTTTNTAHEEEPLKQVGKSTILC